MDSTMKPMKRNPTTTISNRKRKSHCDPSSSSKGTILDFFSKSKQSKKPTPSSPPSSFFPTPLLPSSSATPRLSSTTASPVSPASSTSSMQRISSPNPPKGIMSSSSLSNGNNNNSNNNEGCREVLFGTPATPPPMTPSIMTTTTTTTSTSPSKRRHVCDQIVLLNHCQRTPHDGKKLKLEDSVTPSEGVVHPLKRKKSPTTKPMIRDDSVKLRNDNNNDNESNKPRQRIKRGNPSNGIAEFGTPISPEVPLNSVARRATSSSSSPPNDSTNVPISRNNKMRGMTSTPRNTPPEEIINATTHDSPVTPPSPASEREGCETTINSNEKMQIVETPPSPMSLSQMNTPCSPPTTESEWRKNQDETGKNDEVDAKQKSLDSLLHDKSNKNVAAYQLKRQHTQGTPPFSPSCATPPSTSPAKFTPSTTKSPMRPTTANLPPKKSTPKSKSPKTNKQQSKQQATLFSRQAPSKKKPLFQNSQTNKKRNQFYLDFGQSNFGKQTICDICGMLRVHGLEEDDAQHAKICREYQEGVPFLGWKTERRELCCGDDRIVVVKPGDPPQHRKKVMEVKAIVDAELGFATFAGSSSTSFASAPSNPLEDVTSYLYISAKRVVGLVLVKTLSRAYQLLPPETNGSKNNNGNSDDGDGNPHHGIDSYSRSLQPSKAMMGIHQIWCHRSHRQAGIASKLCDAARSSLVFGMTVPLELVAFSSPTMDGIRFAKRYLGVDTPLVYDMS